MVLRGLRNTTYQAIFRRTLLHTHLNMSSQPAGVPPTCTCVWMAAMREADKRADRLDGTYMPGPQELPAGGWTPAIVCTYVVTWTQHVHTVPR